MLHMLTYLQHSVNSVCFSADGKFIASGSKDDTVKIWSAGSSGTFECQSTGHTGNPVSHVSCVSAVNQVEFIDTDTVVSSSRDGTTRAWDVATGTQKAEFEGDKFSFTKTRDGKRTGGTYVVTAKDDLVLVHLTHGLKEPSMAKNHAVALFHAPEKVFVLVGAGDRIAVGCFNGDVLHLQAPWLLEEA